MQIMHFKADWVDPEKTLREQGIMESEIMTIKRKLFIDDCSKIIDNPIQRNMQYEQVIPVLFLETYKEKIRFLNNHDCSSYYSLFR